MKEKKPTETTQTTETTGETKAAATGGMKRSVKFEINAWVSILMFLGILVVVMLISKNHHKQWDLTANRRFSLSPQSVKLVKELKAPVEVRAYFSMEGESTRDKMSDLLTLYANVSPKFKLELIDTDRSPGRAKGDDIKMYGTVVMVSGKSTEKVTTLDEEKITNALVKLTESRTLPIYFVKGHGEKSIDDFSDQGIGRIKDELTKQAFEGRTLFLPQQKEIPADAAAVVIPGPRMDFAAQETEQLKKYVAKGGRCVFLVDPGAKLANLSRLLGEYGFSLPPLALIDQVSRALLGDAFSIMVKDYSQHPIMKDFELQTVFPLSRPIEKGKAPQGATVEELVMSLPTSLAIAESLISAKEINVQNAKRGPFTLAMAGSYPVKDEKKKEEPPAPGEPEAKKKEGKIAVFGTSTFIDDRYLAAYGNKDLFLNTLSWMAERENLISIRPRESKSAPLMLSQAQGRMAMLYCLFILPGAVIIAGILMLFRRR